MHLPKAKNVGAKRMHLPKAKKTSEQSGLCSDAVVEVTGFEPAAFWSRTKRATKLRYTSSVMEPMSGLEPLTC